MVSSWVTWEHARVHCSLWSAIKLALVQTHALERTFSCTLKHPASLWRHPHTPCLQLFPKHFPSPERQFTWVAIKKQMPALTP